MELSVEPTALHDLGAVRLQAAVQVVEPEPRDAASDPVEDARRHAARDRVPAMRLPPGYEVESLVELREEARDLGRVVLEVAVDRDDDVALRIREAGGERCGLPDV